ncbi:MAG: MerR family transcriptional regulator [Clostridia bacterium]
MIKIGDFAKATGVSVKTLRFYEDCGLLVPIMVDKFTGYRYYDSKNAERVFEICYLKNLGFSLKEIRNLSDKVVEQKLSQVQMQIKKLQETIKTLSTFSQNKGEVVMKKFVNDAELIGKWEFKALVKTPEDFAKGNVIKNHDYNITILHFLPNGEQYWVVSWTKGTITFNGGDGKQEYSYNIKDDLLFIQLKDFQTGEPTEIAVYSKTDSKSYTPAELAKKDNIDLPFIEDKKLNGIWKVKDFVHNEAQFSPNKKYWKNSLFFKKLIANADGKIISVMGNTKPEDFLTYTKGFVLSKADSTASAYWVKKIDAKYYLFMAWKSGDYIFGNMKPNLYVFEKE